MKISEPLAVVRASDREPSTAAKRWLTAPLPHHPTGPRWHDPTGSALREAAALPDTVHALDLDAERRA